MKLHLPKSLLVAVLAACVGSQTTWADFTGPANVTYNEVTGAANGTLTPMGNTYYSNVTDDIIIGIPDGGSTVNVKLNAGSNEINLGEIRTTSLWLYKARYVADNDADLANAGTLYLCGGMLQTTGANMTLSNNIVLGTGTYTESGHPQLSNAAFRVGYWDRADSTLTLSGVVRVEENTRIVLQGQAKNNSTDGNPVLQITNKLCGSGNIQLDRHGNATGTLMISADTSEYTGVLDLDGQNTANGKMTIALGNENVYLGGLSSDNDNTAIRLADGTTASTLSLKVASNGSYTYNGSIGGGIRIVKSGDGTQRLGAVTIEAGNTSLDGLTLTKTIALSSDANLSLSNCAVTDLSGFAFTDTEIDKTQASGIQQVGTTYHLITGNGTASGEVTYGGSKYNVADGIAATRGVYFVAQNDEVTVQNLTGADGYVITGTLIVSDSVSDYVTWNHIEGDGKLSIAFTNNLTNHNRGVTLQDDFTGILSIRGGKFNLKNTNVGRGTLELVAGEIWASDLGTYSKKVLLNAESLDSAVDFAYSSINLSGTVTGNYMRVSGSVSAEYVTLSNAENDIETIKITGRTLNIQNGHVDVVDMSGGTVNISGGSVDTVKISGGSSTITGGTVGAINYNSGGSFTFSKTGETASYTLTGDIKSLSADNYTRKLTIESGVTVTAQNYSNSWGMGLVTIDGQLIIDGAFSLASKSNNDENTNKVTGSGSISAASFSFGNAGKQKISVTSMDIDGNFVLGGDWASGTLEFTDTILTIGGNLEMGASTTLDLVGADVSVSGLLDINTSGRLNMHSGAILSLSENEGIHNISSNVDMAGTDGQRKATINLGENVKLITSSDKNFWIGGNSTVNLAKDATYTRGDITIIGTGNDTQFKRDIIENDGNAYSSTSSDHRVINAIVKNTTEGDVTYNNILENVIVVNEGEGSTLNLTNEKSTLTELHALKGSINVTGQDELVLNALTIAAGNTLTVDTVAVGGSSVVYSAENTGATATLEGGATIDGSLNLSNASSLTLDGISEGSLVTITHDFVLPEGTLTLKGGILDSLADLTAGSQLDIFNIGGEFSLGGQTVTTDLTYESGYTLDKVFVDGSSDYYLGYTGNLDGQGGVVYIGLVPEPTTATLSLLALAALAARRRRR